MNLKTLIQMNRKKMIKKKKKKRKKRKKMIINKIFMGFQMKCYFENSKSNDNAVDKNYIKNSCRKYQSIQ